MLNSPQQRKITLKYVGKERRYHLNLDGSVYFFTSLTIALALVKEARRAWR